MKRVRYAIGATAALTPAAIGMAPAAVAHAATTANAITSAKAKTVSLDHAAAVPALSTCTASGQHTWHINSLIKSYLAWSIQKPGYICVGTQEVKRYFKNNNCVLIDFYVFYGNSDHQSSHRYLTNRCGNAGSTKVFQSGFRKWYPIGTNEPGVEVCVSSTYTSTTCKSLEFGHTG